MVAAMVTRISSSIDKGTKKAAGTGINSDRPSDSIKSDIFSKITFKEVIIAILCCLADFGIAQFGLLTLIQKAYSFLAYLAIPVILIPYLIHMIVTRCDTK